MPKTLNSRARRFALAGARASLLAAAAWLALPAGADEYDEVERLTQAGKHDEAMARAERFLKDKPKDAQMRFQKGVIQLDSGKRNEAIATFTQLTQDAPDMPEPYNNLAVIYAGQNQFDKARTALEAAIRTNPSYATAQENLGDVYARLASQAYSKALQLDQNNTQVQPKLAVIRTLFAPAGSSAIAGTGTATAAAGKRSGDLNMASASAAKAPTAPPPAVTPAPAASPVAKAAPAPAATPAAAATPIPAPKVAAAPSASQAPVPAPASPAPAAAAAQGEVEKAVRAWADAWSDQDMDRYLKAYGPDFAPAGGQARKAWEDDRRARIVGKSRITVGLENLQVKVEGDSATAKFRQIYRADSLNVNSRKTLELVRGANGQWLIRKEAVGG